MIFTEESVKTKTNVDLESWKKYFYDRVEITIREFGERKKGAVDHFVKIEAEMDVKQEILANSNTPDIDEKTTAEFHTRITKIEKEMDLIRDTQKSDEVKTNARLDFMRKQIVLLEDEIKDRLPPIEEEPEKATPDKEKSAKKSTKKKEIVKQKIQKKEITKKKTK